MLHPYYTWSLYDTRNLDIMYLGDYKACWDYKEYLKLMQALADNDGA